MLNATNDDGKEIYAENIKYDYEMFNNEYTGKPDCTGTLSFSIKLPTNSVGVIIKKTRPHIRPTDRIFLSIVNRKEVNDEDSVFDFSQENFSWGVYFQIIVRDTEGNSFLTPRYCTSDFMQPDDLQEIMDWVASVDDIPANGFAITSDAVNLIVDAESKGCLSLFSTEGKRLFYDQNKSHFEVPLAVLKSQIIIARFTSNNETITQKILLK
ncbi:MAG: hypothetical protein K2L05_06325 [Muribaculaceae bacterium]|nr:hypothetical protein [Muribaculaceae bacterium]